MSPELQNQLYEKYPRQYNSIRKIYCSDGWYAIISKCCSVIDDYIEKNLEKGIDLQFEWVQQKSKFGGLRLYYNGGDDFISGVIYMAESISYDICCLCGNKGELCQKNNWLETFCAKCRLENGYEPYKQKINE